MRAGRSGASTRPVSLTALSRGLFASGPMIGLAAALTILTLATTGLYSFEPIYLDQLGATKFIIGLASTVGALAELPGMFWADRLIKRHGPLRIMLIGFAIRCVLMLSVLAFPSVPTIVATHAVGGIAYSFYVVAVVVFVTTYAPEDQNVMALAVFTVTLPALVGMAGSVLGGAIFDAVGAYWLYALALAGYALSWLSLRLAAPTRRA
jgi:PPP family 3-phenylpropionic acid transporter